MADGSITISTSIDDSGVKKGVKTIEGSFDKLKTTVAKTIAAMGVGKLAKDFISTGIQYNAEIEKYQTALTTLTGSAEEANRIVKQIKEDAAKTPFDVAGLTQANQLLISTGLSADDSRETILALGNAVSATGGGNEELSRMAVNLQQIKNTGKAAAIDIKQFAFAGIDIYGLLADYLGITKQEAAEMEVTWEDLNGALINASKEGGKYFGAMTTQSTTLNGQWSTLKDNFKEFTGQAMEPLSNLLKDTVLPLLNDLITGAENTKNWINEHQTLLTVLVGVVGTLTAAIIAYIISQNAAAIAMGILSGAISIATAVSSAFGAVMAFITSPITLVVLAIGALITIIVLLVKNWNTVKEKALEVWDNIKTSLSETIDKIVQWFKELPYTIGYHIGNLLGKIIQFGNNAKNWAVTKIPEIINSIINWFKKLPENIKIQLTNVINRIIDWGSEMKAKGKAAAEDLSNAVKDTLANLPDKIKEVGSNIVQGLWNGITGAKDWIKNKVGEFAKGILDGMKNALGIHSPSRVFRDEVGKYIALGVGEGFTKNISSVYKQMKAAVDFETQKISANVATNTELKVAAGNGVVTTNNNDNGITVNQNFYEKKQSPYEIAKEARNTLRRVAYGI